MRSNAYKVAKLGLKLDNLKQKNLVGNYLFIPIKRVKLGNGLPRKVVGVKNI